MTEPPLNRDRELIEAARADALKFHVEDPDQHVLRFGSDSREDKPISEWGAWYETNSWIEREGA